MGTFSIWHWLVVLAVIILIFGTKKLRNLGGDLGTAVRGFKKGMKEDDKDDTEKPVLSETQTEEQQDKTPTH